MKKRCAGPEPTALLELCPQQGPSPLISDCWKSGPDHQKYPGEYFVFHFHTCFTEGYVLALSPRLSTCVWRGHPRNKAGQLPPGLETPTETRRLRSLFPSLPECFFHQITTPVTTASATRTRPTMTPMMGTGQGG